MLRNNADARRCSYFELGLPVIVLYSLPNFQVYITPSYMKLVSNLGPYLRVSLTQAFV